MRQIVPKMKLERGVYPGHRRPRVVWLEVRNGSL